MKFKLLVKLVEKLLGMSSNSDEPRADMYLPDFLLAFAIVLLAGGTACVLFAIFSFALWAVVGAVLGLGLGIVALLCWKNQTIRMISGTHFEYTTFLGNTYTFAFSEIKSLRKNQDSLTLFVADKKVHIESMAIISERLAAAINKELQKLG